MDETTYKFLMGSSAFVIAILGGMLWTTIISPESGLDKLRKARNILVSSYFVLAFLSLICCFTGYDRHIEPASTLFVASFQALLFTVSMLVFIRPGAVRWSVVFRHAVAITVAGITLFVVLFCFTGSFMWFFYEGIIAYVAQLAFYTWKFMLAYRKTVQEVEDYYDDDEESRLYWVKIGFYSALAIGIMALSLLFYPGIYKFFVPLYVLFYSFIVMWFVNYYHKMKFAIQQCNNLTTLKLTAPGNLTLKINPGMGIPPFDGRSFAKACHLTLNVAQARYCRLAQPKRISSVPDTVDCRFRPPLSSLLC